MFKFSYNHDDFDIDALILDLKLIKFADLKKYPICLFIHKLQFGIVSNVFNDYFTGNSSIHAYKTRLSEGFHIAKIGNGYEKWTLKYNGCLLGNKIILLNVNFDGSLASL